jgi:hypothetical protein
MTVPDQLCATLQRLPRQSVTACGVQALDLSDGIGGFEPRGVGAAMVA